MSGDFIIIYLSVHFECIALAVQPAACRSKLYEIKAPDSGLVSSWIWTGAKNVTTSCQLF